MNHLIGVLGSYKSPAGVQGITSPLISDLQLWLDGADPLATGTPPANGTSIPSWKDKSGNAAHVTSSGTCVYDSLSRSISLTSGSYSNSTISSGTFDNAISIFAVYRGKGSGSFNPLITRSRAGYNLGNPDMYNGNRVYMVSAGNFAIRSSTYNLDNSTSTVNLFVYSMNQSTNNISEWTNGNTNTLTNSYSESGLYSLAANMDSTNNFNSIYIGTRGDGVTGQFTGILSEILIYNIALTTTQRQETEGYLASKWGIQSQLPTNHPYYAIRWPPVNRPPVITGLRLHLDANDASTITLSGSTVTSWADKSGSNNNATGVGGLTFSNSSVVFNGTSGYFSTPYTSQATTETAFIIIQFNNVSSRQDIISTSANLSRAYVLESNGTTNLQRIGSAVYITPGISPIINTRYLLVYDISSTAGNLYAYGSLSLNATGSFPFSAGNTNIGGFGIGNGNYLNGSVSEVLIYNTVLTLTQRQNVEGYLAWKWGLRAQLPSNHPYRNSSPLPQQPIIGLQVWVDGSDPLATGTTPANGTAVTTWSDKSGRSNNMIASNNGTYSANSQNGLGTITFSNSMYRSAITNISYYPADVYLVVRVNSVTAHNDICGISQVGADSFNSLTFSEYTQSRWHNGSSGFSRTPNAVSTSNETSTNFLLMSWSIANNNFYIYRNGVRIVLATTYTWTPPASVVFLLGKRIDSTPGQNAGRIAEVLVYTSQLNTTNRQEVEGYLAWKWGLQRDLPTNHPYYINGPPAPTNVSMSRFIAGNTGVTVTWTASTGATSYIVDFYSNTSPSTIGGIFFQSITVATTTATSTTTLAGARYYYTMVTAVNSVGEPSAETTSSNTTSVFTLVSGLFVWLDSQDPTSYTLSGSTLASPGWIDKVTNLAFRPQNGGASNAVTSSANYPTLSNAGTTSAGIYFPNASSAQSSSSVGIQANLSSAPLTFPTQNMTVCLVITNTANNISPAGRLSCCLQLATNTISTRPNVYFLVHTNTNEGFGISQDYNGSVWGRALYTNVPTHTVSKQILIGRSTSNLTTVHQNGTSIYSNATVYNSAFTNYNIYNLGIAVNNNGARCWEGTVHEIMVFNKFLTDTERILVEGYLAWKCGMNTSLPSGHLYRNAAPT